MATKLFEYESDCLWLRQFSISTEWSKDEFDGKAASFTEQYLREQLRNAFHEVTTKQALDGSVKGVIELNLGKFVVVGEVLHPYMPMEHPSDIHVFRISIKVEWSVDETPWWSRPELRLPSDAVR